MTTKPDADAVLSDGSQPKILDPDYRAEQLQAIYLAFLNAGMKQDGNTVRIDDKMLRNAVLCLKEANDITAPSKHGGGGADPVAQFIEGMASMEAELEAEREALRADGQEVTLTLSSREEAIAHLEALLEEEGKEVDHGPEAD